MRFEKFMEKMGAEDWGFRGTRHLMIPHPRKDKGPYYAYTEESFAPLDKIPLEDIPRCLVSVEAVRSYLPETKNYLTLDIEIRELFIPYLKEKLQE